MIQTSHEDGVLHVMISRPEKKNALTAEMYASLAEALQAGNTNTQVRAFALYGEGDCFTAGNDLGDFLNNPPVNTDAPVYRFVAAIAAAEKPIVAAVSGAAVGIGTTMLLHCDLVYAAQSARFRLPFVALGLCPEAGSSYLLPRIAGKAKATELLLLGDRFGAEEALEIGLVNEVVADHDAAVQRATEIAARIATLPPAAVRLTKSLIRASTLDAVAATIERESRHFVERLSSAEAKEAFAAFLEKRPPDFSQFQ